MHEGSLTFPHPPEERPERGASIRDLGRALLRHRRVFFAVAGATLLLTLLWTFATPKRFSSEMVLLVQNARGKDLITPGESGVTSTADVTEEQLNSEIAVLAKLRLCWMTSSTPAGDSGSPASISRQDLLRHDAKPSQSLRGRLDVSAIRSSHAITVKLATTDPEEGRATLSLLLSAFLTKQSQLGRPPGIVPVLQRAGCAVCPGSGRRTIASLASYQQAHGFVSLD